MSSDELDDDDFLVSQLNIDISNQYVVFSVADEEYGVPILAVQEIISLPEMTKIPGLPDYIPGVINLRGSVIPLYELKKKFGFGVESSDSRTVAVILQLEGGRTVGMIVDAVSDVVSITEENIRPTPDFSGKVDVRFVENLGQLGERMIIILDTHNLFTFREAEILDKISDKG